MKLAEKYTLRAAAKEKTMSLSSLKTECRRLKLMIWPYRSFQAANNCLHSPHISVSNKSHVEKYLRLYKANPLNMKTTPKWILALRKHMYKQRCKTIIFQQTTSENYVEVMGESPPPKWYLSIDVSVTEFDEPFYLCWHPANRGSS